MVYNADFNPDLEHHVNVSNDYLFSAGFERYQRCLKDLDAPVWDEVRQTLAEYRPDVLGVTVKTQNYHSALQVARLAKQQNPDCFVIFGGPHPTMAGEESLEDPVVDMTVLAEGENTLVEILQTLSNSETPEFGAIAGIIYRGPDGLVRTPARGNHDNLDDFPNPIEALPEVLKDFDVYPANALARIFATRGCPYQCTFCGSVSMWTRKVRFRSPQNVVGEIKALLARGATHVHFEDDTFGVKKSYIRELCALIAQECPGLSWSCEITVQLADDENLRNMRAAGCHQVTLGIESGDDEMLKRIKKNITTEQAVAAVERCRKHDITPYVFLMFGFPEEDEKSIRGTLDIIPRLNSPSICFSVFTPYPGSQLFEQCKSWGMIDDKMDYSRFNHQSPDNHFSRNLSKETLDLHLHEAIRRIDRQEARVAKRMRRERGLRLLREQGGFAALRWALSGVARRLAPRPAE
ncbi:putative Fe-S oxidoreductase [Magnetofaba australis IT-1]|uniref:Putative Fe-S oxidoreductase n=2 Tax=Magnetofaba TaxID=1472292 RepID=A0A1Y2K3B1_9PROT|nr:putative Fe-S oxidoreductase [Magnetofaba australis IT-1]